MVLWQISVDGQHRPAQYCKAMIPQLKKNKKFTLGGNKKRVEKVLSLLNKYIISSQNQQL